MTFRILVQMLAILGASCGRLSTPSQTVEIERLVLLNELPGEIFVSQCSALPGNGGFGFVDSGAQASFRPFSSFDLNRTITVAYGEGGSDEIVRVVGRLSEERAKAIQVRIYLSDQLTPTLAVDPLE